jgi:hypothetical protein
MELPTTDVSNLIRRLLASEVAELDMAQAFRLVRECDIPASPAYLLVAEEEDAIDEINQAMLDAGYSSEDVLQASMTDKCTPFSIALEGAIVCNLPLDTLPEVLAKSGRELRTRDATMLIKALLEAGKSSHFIAQCLFHYSETLDTLHQQMTLDRIIQPVKYDILYELLQLQKAEMRKTQKIEG